MSKVSRKLANKGYYSVEHGVNSQLESPSQELLLQLKEQRWINAETETYPDERQVGFYHRLIDLIGRLARDEELALGTFNRLEQGIWELKVNNIRMTFYDTKGDGTFTPKLGSRKEHLGRTYWELPYDFDLIIRLGFCWEKQGEKASREDIEASQAFRMEDVAHDSKC